MKRSLGDLKLWLALIAVVTLAATPATAQVITQLTDFPSEMVDHRSAIDDAGTEILARSSGDLAGGVAVGDRAQVPYPDTI